MSEWDRIDPHDPVVPRHEGQLESIAQRSHPWSLEIPCWILGVRFQAFSIYSIFLPHHEDSPAPVKPTAQLAEATTPEGAHLALYEHDGQYFLKADGAQLMTSFAHGSEDQLARLACAPFRPVSQPQILIGGLGLGYTLATACTALRSADRSILG